MNDSKSVVITGASTGIGHGIVKVLAGKGLHVFGGVRKQADADRLQAEFGAAFTPLLMDVTDSAAVHAAAATVASRLEGRTLSGLVNNAGIAGGGPLLLQPEQEFRNILEVNLLGPFTVTQAFGSLLGADRTRTGQPGRIIQISSVAGRLGFPFLGAYAASKFALEGMSESLRRELLLYGIDVIVVGPGSVKTPIFDKAQAADVSHYENSDYASILKGFVKFFLDEAKRGLEPEEIGRVVYTALTTRKPKVRYAAVPQRFKNWTIPKLLPKRFLDRAIGKQMGLTYQARNTP